jgi:phosphatidylglycerophosphatase A
MSFKDTSIKCLASGFYSGYSSFIPGTTGTLPAWLIAWFLIRGDINILAGATVVMTALSVILASAAENLLGHDSKKIVVDEWAGMFISLLFIPYTLTNYIIAFVAFRGFDAIKIYPANAAEKLPRGWGVTADDVVAGIQANVFAQIIIYILSLI